METSKRSKENTDHVNSDGQGATGSQVRFYECNFCKRGFSNAQALGGHMNIHRKDKSKLKFSSNETQQLLDTPKLAPSISSKIEANCSKDRSSSIKWPWILDKERDATSRDKTHIREIQQLPLFADKSSSKEQQKPSSQVHGNNEKGFSSSSGLSSSELDLELRLGPQPLHTSPASGTQKFF